MLKDFLSCTFQDSFNNTMIGTIVACCDNPSNGPYYVIVDENGKSVSRYIHLVTITSKLS